MSIRRIDTGRGGLTAVLLALLAVAPACKTEEYWIGGGASAIAARTPSNDLEQIYYFGVFDPMEQLPPQVYRVRVRGQSSAISFMRFSSGWVRAELIDSLNASVAHDPESGRVTISRGESEKLAGIKPGRRLVLFGPEGYREAPADHRLVIVMGANPDKFFSAIDEGLATAARAQSAHNNAELQRVLLEAMREVKDEQAELAGLERDVALQVPVANEAS